MSYELRFARSAEVYLSRLDRRTQERMARTLRAIAASPFGHGTKPLTNAGRFRAARVGTWRTVYLVDEHAGVVRVETIGPRGQVYRDL